MSSANRDAILEVVVLKTCGERSAAGMSNLRRGEVNLLIKPWEGACGVMELTWQATGSESIVCQIF